MNTPSSPHQDYEDCSGCTDPRSEGTHQSHTKQHPCPPGGDPDCGYCFPTQSSSEKLNVVNLPEPFPYKPLNIEVTTHASSPQKYPVVGAGYVIPMPSSEKGCECWRYDKGAEWHGEWCIKRPKDTNSHPNTSSEKDYSHTHCWDQKQPPACGLKGEHKKCCLCDAEQRSSEKECRHRTPLTSECTSCVQEKAHPNTEQEEMPQRIKNAYQLGAQTERARIRKLVEGMKKPNVAYVNIIRNRTLTDIFSLLEE